LTFVYGRLDPHVGEFALDHAPVDLQRHLNRHFDGQHLTLLVVQFRRIRRGTDDGPQDHVLEQLARGLFGAQHVKQTEQSSAPPGEHA
jgi:hypothetical protein